MTISEKIKKGLNKVISDIHSQVWYYHEDFHFGEVTLESMKEIRSYLELMIQKKESSLSNDSYKSELGKRFTNF